MFRISLEEFEGPLDLLLFFIKRDELDIYNIPVSRITSEFIAYIDRMNSLNLEVAAEFIYMASLLMSIKVKMLLPRELPDDSDAEEFDPRTELVERLLEYKRIKEGSVGLRKLEERRADMFSRGCFEDADPEVLDEMDEPLNRPTLYNLIMAYKSVMDRVPEARVQNVEEAPVTVDEQCEYILNCLSERVQVSFRNILEHVSDRLVLVVTFLAVLELCRRNRITVLTKDGYNDFWMSRKH
ncbi:ScpA family protein [Prosthecochloris sp. HL-130-GSB]|uniref:Segregation and condensation protein A n=1 Tax=Prosthecochloris aestuarii TaxID=1102 RepID=A0A831WV31_PROAE|nr:segregation/condensation protein A [Prosthecochloris sp. HL-130-GSB]ARM31815.1 chromosome segregation protein ScpA [Prosthecochloris sp. HL-130-GSB]MBO8092273.1 segregation/condensation protein A [Prosthecochloris sp.]HED30804.1 chromosome segregation protein ScpA [Prosthecochloris aestuarii]